MSIVLYAHGGSGNHGCEAIIRSTISLIKNQLEFPILMSYNIEEDKKYHLDELVNLKQELGDINKFSMDFIKAYLNQKFKHEYYQMDALLHKQSIDSLKNVDIALFVGGDNYCYSNVKSYIYINNYFRKKAKHLVLWGASIDPDLLKDKDVVDDLSKYDIIFARESISYNALKSINKNTYLYVDPAFYLECEKIQIPVNFEENNTVGINISPMIINHEEKKGIALKNYELLIEYLLEKTQYKIALIPHVVWETNDDRIPLDILYQKYKHTDRVIMVDDNNCQKQKYIISKCKFFVGARTHSTIAAYSTCIPTLVVGYSTKAKGIAKDLFGTYDNYVIPVQKLIDANTLKYAFQWLMEHETDIKNQLENKMDTYFQLKDIYAKEIYEL